MCGNMKGIHFCELKSLDLNLIDSYFTNKHFDKKLSF